MHFESERPGPHLREPYAFTFIKEPNNKSGT